MLALCSLGLRLLLAALPRRHRLRFGAEMVEVFAAQCREAAAAHGLPSLVRVCARTYLDLLRTALAMRFRPWRSALRSTAIPARERPPMLDPLLQDVRYAGRLLRASPAFTLAAVLTLALGIGANAAVFSLVNALLFRTLPGVAGAERVVALFSGYDGQLGVSSYMNFRDLQERVDAFAALAAYKSRLMDLTNVGETSRIEGMMVTGEYFSALGIRPAVGRLLGPEDDVEVDGHPVAVLSWGAWQRRFAGAPGVVGREVLLNGRAFTVVGVTPRGFAGTSLDSGRPEIFASMMMQPHFMPSSGNLLGRRGWGGVLVIGRLADGATLAHARAQVGVAADWLRETYPEFAADLEFGLVPLSQAALSPQLRGPVSRVGALLAAVSAMVLLVACVNLANLLLARAAARRREIAVRQALGAGRGRVARQLVVETIVLALLGGGMGLALANFVLESFDLLPLDLPEGVGLDARVLAFTLGVSVLAGVLFGVFPALSSTRSDLAYRLRDSGDLRRSRGRRPAASFLVVGQVALSTALMVVAGLFARTLVQLQGVDLGFEPGGVAVMTVDPALQGYEPGATATFYRELLARVAAEPGVAAVSLTSQLPGPDADDTESFYVEGIPEAESPALGLTLVGVDYLNLLGVPMARGRYFQAADAGSSAFVGVVNQAAADTLRGRHGLEILGRRMGPQGPDGPLLEVVGVTAPSKTGDLRAEPAPMLYLLHPQVVGLGMGARMTLVARTAGDAEVLSGRLAAALSEVDPNVPAVDVGTLAAHVAGTLEQDRSVAAMVGASALLSLALAIVGLYGLLSYAVSRRTGEMGIRMALGARTVDVSRLVIRQGAALAAVGVLLGLAIAVAGSRLLESFLYGVSGIDPLTYMAMAALLLAVAVLAAWLPARRATRVDPVRALRAE